MATLDAITAYFPDKTLTPLSSGTDEPTYASIKKARDELNGNAASIPSLRGGGIHGHLALTLTDAEYLQIANEAFDAPVHPGPLVYTANATGPQQVEQARLYKLNLEEFRVYLAVNQALRNQLLASVNPTYLLAVKDPILGFGQITCLALITHLRTVYGIITPMMLTQNKKKMAANWHPPTPIEDLFEQLRVGMEFAIEGGDAMSVQEQVRLGYNIIDETGLFTQACRDWRILTPVQQTFDEFKIHFKKWDRDRRYTDTSASAGYHGANQAVGCPITPLSSVAPPNDAMDARFDAMQLQIAALVTALSASKPTSAAFPSTVSLAGSVITQATTLHPTAIANTYCWTHGISRNPQHTSTTCEHPGEGHQRTATMTNQMGGSTRVWTAADRRAPR
jgi:hypothetical protein